MKGSETDLGKEREGAKAEKDRESEQIKRECHFWDQKEVNDLSEIGQGGTSGIWERVKLKGCICAAEICLLLSHL